MWVSQYSVPHLAPRAGENATVIQISPKYFPSRCNDGGYGKSSHSRKYRGLRTSSNTSVEVYGVHSRQYGTGDGSPKPKKFSSPSGTRCFVRGSRAWCVRSALARTGDGVGV